MTLLPIQIYIETCIFLSTKVIWERGKRIKRLFIDLKILPSQKNEIFLWKMASKVGMYWATHESVIVPVGRDRKIRTALRTTNQIAGFVTVPSKKKKTIFIYSQSFNNKINHALVTRVFPHLRQSACCYTEHSLALCDIFNCSDWLVWITLTKGWIEIKRSSQLRTLLKRVVENRTWKKKKIQARTGFEPMTSATPMQRYTNWANEPRF